MAFWSRIQSFVRAVAGRRRIDREMDEEWQFHIAVRVEALKAGGVAQAAAERRARMEFGDPLRWKEEGREARGLRWAQDLSGDVRYALRQMRRAPGFALVIVVTLALGIGANTAIFTLLDAVVLKPLALPAAGELVMLYENGPEGAPDPDGGSGRFLRFSYPRFGKLQQALGAEGSLAAVTRTFTGMLRRSNGSRRTAVRAQLASGQYFSTLNVRASRGRLLSDEDVFADGGAPVAVISDGLWRRAFGASDEAIGEHVLVNRLDVTIVGVAPSGFGGLWTDQEGEIWLPATLQSAIDFNNNSSSYGTVDLSRSWLPEDRIAWLNLFARIHGADLPRARLTLESANHLGVLALASTFRSAKDREQMESHTLAVESLERGFSGLRARYTDVLLILTAIVGVVLLVTCANIANLMLVRAAGHAREIGVRISLGASTGRLVRQFLTESLMLAGAGGALGVAIGEWGSAAIARSVTGTTGALPLVFSPDRRVLAAAAGLSAATAILFGLAPALRAMRVGRAAALGMNQRMAVSQSPARSMAPLVALQIALSVMVVFAAALLGRTMVNFTRLDPGFDVDHLVSAKVNPESAEQAVVVAGHLTEAARRVPGVVSAVVSRCGLISGCSSSGGVSVEGQAVQSGGISRNWVGPTYFATVGIPVIAGRDFDERDMTRKPGVAIISQSVARRLFKDENPIGRHIGLNRPDEEIVGIVPDVRSQTLHDPPIPMVYLPMDEASYHQLPMFSIDMRVAGPAATMVAPLRDAFRRAEPDGYFNTFGAMSTYLDRDLSRERIAAYLASAFAALALMLASLGLYGVLSYNVARRTQEIGVRMALGARRSQVLALVLRQGAVLTAVGIVVGLAGAAAAGRYIQGMLFGLSPLDRSMAAGVVAILIGVALVASLIPARRATKVDPLVALRCE